MAQEAEKEGGGEEETPKKKFPLWVIILIASQVVLVIVAIVVLKMLSGQKVEEKVEEPSRAEEKVNPEKMKDPKAFGGPQYKVQPFIVNLIDDGRGPKFLKLEMNFELETPPGYKPSEPASGGGGGHGHGGGSAASEESLPVKAELDSRTNQIRDEILMLLTSKRQTDIETSDGKRILRDEIFTRVNKILVTGAIRRVFFTEFVIQ